MCKFYFGTSQRKPLAALQRSASLALHLRSPSQRSGTVPAADVKTFAYGNVPRKFTLIYLRKQYFCGAARMKHALKTRLFMPEAGIGSSVSERAKAKLERGLSAGGPQRSLD